MNLRPLALAVVLAAIAGGCASTSTVMMSPALPALMPEQVRVYFTPPPGHYVEIAMLETSSGGFTYGEQNKMNSVLAKLRTEAAKIGANGVLIQDTTNGYGGSSVGVGVGSGGYGYGGHSHVSGGVGVSISPTPKYARAIAIHVDNPPSADPGAPPRQ